MLNRLSILFNYLLSIEICLLTVMVAGSGTADVVDFVVLLRLDVVARLLVLV